MSPSTRSAAAFSSARAVRRVLTSWRRIPGPPRDRIKARLLRLHTALLARFGAQRWWEGGRGFDVAARVMVTSSAAWPNGGRIVAALRARALLGPRKLATMPDRDVGRLIVSAGGDRRTAPRLGSFARWLVTRFGGRFDPLRRLPLAPLRAELLRVRGLGRETVDAILLYAAHRPVFVADLPVRRVLARHRVIRADADYETTRAFLEAHLPSDPALFNEMHALLVQVGRTYCSTPPRCGDCPLRGDLRNRPPARG